MTLSTIEKAIKIERGLRQLRSELSAAKQPNQVNAINDFLLNANDDSKARLYDILVKMSDKYPRFGT